METDPRDINNSHIPAVEELFKNPHIRNVDEWTGLVYMSRSNLNRKIQEHYGGRYTPKEFIYEARLKLIQKILESDPNITCQNLAVKANFSSRRYLMLFFSRQLDTTFSSFRKNPKRFSFLKK